MNVYLVLMWVAVGMACTVNIEPAGTDAGGSQTDAGPSGADAGGDSDAAPPPPPNIVAGEIEFERGLGVLGTVYEVAFGRTSVLVSYEKPLSINSNRWPTNDGTFSAVRVGFATLDRQTTRRDIQLITDIDIAPLVDENGIVWQYFGDEEAVISYDRDEDEFVVAWARAWYDKDNSSNKHYGLYAQRIDAATGALLGSIESPIVLADQDEYPFNKYQIDLAYDKKTASFLLIWALSDDCINCGGSGLYSKVITRDADKNLVVPDEPTFLVEAAKWPTLAGDDDGQFLVTYTRPQTPQTKPIIEGLRVYAERAGDMVAVTVSDTLDLVAPLSNSWAWFDSQVTYDRDNDQFMVSYTQPWDMVVHPVAGDPAADTGDPNIIDVSGHDYSPTVAYVHANGKYLMSFGKDGSDFFDCLNDVSAVWLSPSGEKTGDPQLAINSEIYTGTWRTRAAGHPQYGAAAVAWGMQSDPCDWEADPNTIDGGIYVYVLKID